MAIVVEQTIPFPASSLDLHNAHRWTKLLPLIRPSVKARKTTQGRDVLIDGAVAKSKFAHIVAVGKSGNFSSKLLEERSVTAIVVESAGGPGVTLESIEDALQSEGIQTKQGIVVVRQGKKNSIERHGTDVVEVQAENELSLDHILHVLGSASDSCRASLDNTTELLQLFAKSASTAHSTFHVEKAEGNPAVLHTDGAAGFEKARHAVERDLKYILKTHEAQAGEVTYSVHYSDTNGLSRLENYIIAGEVASYMEAQNLQYRLSHSTLLNHRDAARGFSISICPLPSRHLAAQPKPHVHTSTSPQQDSQASQPSSSSSSSKMTFNDDQVRRSIHAGCEAVIAAEPTITEYDTIAGDGDCGYTLRDGARKVLSFIQDKDLGHLPSILGELVQELEVDMGGTSGALYCIFLTSLSAALGSEGTMAGALSVALGQLMVFTRARVGDRTMMDVLIPFIETLGSGNGKVGDAVEQAKMGVERTKGMVASLGRSAYLDEKATKGVPDPGAYGLCVLLEGMCKN
ncbi:hypothetical protein LTR62_003003 [Meristemomyces frigidus]|uniref:DhaL domain-containing protein n=1 Tax=Meristemomyces frigidus TaxID=1508187 RepID=A0AAN7TYA0_9PEZI|nr:hypothetical protein LTR62_003003 [Meristemomyces frigidus]